MFAIHTASAAGYRASGFVPWPNPAVRRILPSAEITAIAAARTAARLGWAARPFPTHSPSWRPNGGRSALSPPRGGEFKLS